MHFIHRNFLNNDPIAAIATPAGDGAIAVIRISGNGALEIADSIFSGNVKSYQTHTAHYGKILDENSDTIDSVLLLVMKAPRSYTGEDSVEISCHGGSLITRKVLERIFRAGARPAQPGEFSLRAFLNGKIDLAQAEAVQQFIASKGELSLQNAERQLAGALSKKIHAFQKELTEIAAILEAWVDFPEEGLEFSTFEDLIDRLVQVQEMIQILVETFHEGRLLQEGISLCLVGTPNVGKSSLMNAMLGFDRAIVTDIAGTTRDLLEEDYRIGGLPFRLVDTAGIRDSDEIVEQEGIRRSKAAFAAADLILLLLDASRPLQTEDREILAIVPKEKTILVWNKIDIATPREKLCWDFQVCISAKEAIGLDTLREEILKCIWKKGPPSKDEIAITQLRHRDALLNANRAIAAVIDGLRHRVSAEFVTADARTALYELGTILGTNVDEDILSSIFSQFCLGK